MLVWEGHSQPVVAVAFGPDGHLVTGDRGGRLVVRDAVGQTSFERSHPVAEPVSAIDFRVDGVLYWAVGKRLTTAGPFLDTGDPSVRDSIGMDQPVAALSWLTTTLLAVGCGDNLRPRPGHFLLWNDKIGFPKEPRFLEPAGVKAVSSHRDGRLVAWANASRRVTVWDTTKADPQHFNQTHNAQAVSWHPDGVQLAATTDRLGKVYDVAAKRERLSLKGHTGLVTAVAFSPDGRLLVTGSWDGTVRSWDTATGAERDRFDWGVGRVLCLAFDKDGQRLAAGGDKGAVAIWDV